MKWSHGPEKKISKIDGLHIIEFRRPEFHTELVCSVHHLPGRHPRVRRKEPQPPACHYRCSSFFRKRHQLFQRNGYPQIVIVEESNPRRCGLRQSCVPGHARTPVRCSEVPNSGVPGGEARTNFSGFVGRTVVDDQNLDLLQRLLKDGPNCSLKEPASIVCWNNGRNRSVALPSGRSTACQEIHKPKTSTQECNFSIPGVAAEGPRGRTVTTPPREPQILDIELLRGIGERRHVSPHQEAARLSVAPEIAKLQARPPRAGLDDG